MDAMPNLLLALEDLNGDDLIAVELGMVVLIKQSLDVAVDACHTFCGQSSASHSEFVKLQLRALLN